MSSSGGCGHPNCSRAHHLCLLGWWMCRDGCRSDADYIYKDELEAFLDKGVLKV